VLPMEELLTEVLARSALPPPGTRRQIRVSAGVSQERVGREVGVDRATVCRWESGDREPSLAHAVAYLRVLQTLKGATRAPR
jgi:DNA-binding XRE family transcriptional regulator